jgi:hypothetical protein
VTMTEYQTAIIRLSGKSLADEESLTDELNERRLGGWTLVELVALGPRKVLAVFQREG